MDRSRFWSGFWIGLGRIEGDWRHATSPARALRALGVGFVNTDRQTGRQTDRQTDRQGMCWREQGLSSACPLQRRALEGQRTWSVGWGGNRGGALKED